MKPRLIMVMGVWCVHSARGTPHSLSVLAAKWAEEQWKKQ